MYSDTVNKLINQFERLPGIGHKSAVRLAFYVLESPKEVAEEMAKTLIEAKEEPETHSNLIVKFCGFNTYFNDLPKGHQILLINRALKSEGK